MKKFRVDDKPYKPHITLARRCIMNRNYDEKSYSERIKPILMEVTKVQLMKSEHMEGKLVYTSLGEAVLQEE